MVSLCVNKNEIHAALNSVKGSGYLKSVIYSYLESYGVGYNFNEFYLQYSRDDVTAVILRYNTYIYLINNDSADSEELSAFLCGFSGSVLLCETIPFDTNVSSKTCYLMSNLRGVQESTSKVLDISDSPKIVSDLVAEDMTLSHRNDFFLNTAHMLRHRTLKAFACFLEDKAVAVTGVTCEYNGVSAITFVFTDKHFRGNGYSKDVLNSVCSSDVSEYQLLCEEHNIEFYKKCGFNQVSTCYEVCL